MHGARDTVDHTGVSATATPRRWSAEATAIVAVGASLLIALAALLAPLRADVRDLRGEVSAIRAGVAALSDRVAHLGERVEGALSGPYRLSNPTPETDQP